MTIVTCHLLSCFVAYESYCPALPTLENGDIDVNSRHVDSTATYTCHPGYAINVDAMKVRICLADVQFTGKWSPDGEPSCNRMYSYGIFYPEMSVCSSVIRCMRSFALKVWIRVPMGSSWGSGVNDGTPACHRVCGARKLREPINERL